MCLHEQCSLSCKELVIVSIFLKESGRWQHGIVLTYFIAEYHLMYTNKQTRYERT